MSDYGKYIRSTPDVWYMAEGKYKGARIYEGDLEFLNGVYSGTYNVLCYSHTWQINRR